MKKLILALMLLVPTTAMAEAPQGDLLAALEVVPVHIGFQQPVELSRQVFAPFGSGMMPYAIMFVTDFNSPGWYVQRLVYFYSYSTGRVSEWSVIYGFNGERLVANKRNGQWGFYNEAE